MASSTFNPIIFISDETLCALSLRMKQNFLFSYLNYFPLLLFHFEFFEFKVPKEYEEVDEFAEPAD